MPDSDSSLDILIRLGLVGDQDAIRAKELLKETADAAKEVGNRADYLNPAFVNSARSMEETAAASAKAGTNYRLFALAAEQAGVNIPGLSVLLRGLMNPEFIGLAAGVAGMELFFGHLRKVQEAQFEWIKRLQQTNDALHEITASGKPAADQLIEINKALAEGQVAARGHAAAIEAMTNEWRRYDEIVKDAGAAETQANTDANAALTTKIDLLEKAGSITKETAEAMKAEAAYEAELAKIKAERDAKELEYQNTLKKRNETQDKLEKFPNQSDLLGLQERDEKALARNEKIISDMPGVIAKQLSDLADAHNRFDVPEEHRISANIDRDKALLAQAIKDNPALEKKIAQDKDSLDAVKALTKQVEDLQAQLRVQNQGILDFDKSAPARQGAAEHQRNLTEFGGGAADLLKRLEELASNYAKNPSSVSAGDQTEMVRLAESATGRAQTVKSSMGVGLAALQNVHAALDMVDRISDSMARIAALIPALNNRIARIESQLAGIPIPNISPTGQ